MESIDNIEKSKKRERELTEEDILLENYNTKKICIDPNDLVCPITKQIFCIPVTCDDGFTYEKWALDNILNGDRTKVSPINRNPISKYCENTLINKSVNEFLNGNPEFKKLQFEDKVYYDFIDNLPIITRLFGNNDFNSISKYNGIHLNYGLQRETIIGILSKKCINIEYLNKILDNCVDLNTKDDNEKLPIYHICANGTYNMISCAFQKTVELYDVYKKNVSVIHVLLFKNAIISNDDKMILIRYLIEQKNIDLNIKYENKSIMHHICVHCTFDIILCALEKNVELYKFNDDSESIMNVLLNNENLLNGDKMVLVKFLIEKTNINLNKKDNFGISLMHHICVFCPYDVIMSALENNANIYDINRDNDSIVHVLNKNNLLIENKMMLIEYLFDKKKLDLTYKNKKNVTVLSQIFRDYDNCELLINKLMNNPTLKINVLFNLTVIQEFILYKKYKFLSDYVQLLYKILDSINVNEISDSYKEKVIQDINKCKLENKLCKYPTFISIFEDCLHDLNDNDHIEPRDKIYIAEKLVDIFITKINIDNIDADLDIYSNKFNKDWYNENVKNLMTQWDKKVNKINHIESQDTTHVLTSENAEAHNTINDIIHT